jgi:hypothetical protein
MPKRYFAYDIIFGSPCPVLFYDDKPTDGQGKSTVDHYKQFIEINIKEFNLSLTQLVLKYPYVEEKKEDENV